MADNARGSREFIERLRSRALRLAESGLDQGESMSVAWLEERIRQWPTKWGDDMWVLIAGDFDPPAEDLQFPELGIVVHKEKQEKSVIHGALCVLRATIANVPKSVEGIQEASRRIGLLLGALALDSWGNSSIRWWSYVTHDSGGSAFLGFGRSQEVSVAIKGILQLPTKVRSRVEAALYWIREPRSLALEFHRRDELGVYAAWWNAFECLVEAVCLLRPQPKVAAAEKERRIAEVVRRRRGRLTVGDIDGLCRDVLNPGFVAKASHALAVCFPEEHDRYVRECFRMKPQRQRLYDIRNAIAHGEVDAEDVRELIRIGNRLLRLKMIVLGMFGRLVPYRYPLDKLK